MHHIGPARQLTGLVTAAAATRAVAVMVVAVVVAGCNKRSDVFTGSAGNPNGIPMCTVRAPTESSCTDGADDDCDGYIDCRDSDCDGQACGNGLTCTAGGCLGPGALPNLPRIENLRVTMRGGDTAVVEFEPVDGALDYRIYPLPSPNDILVGTSGELAIRNAIYRCAGDRPIGTREDDPASNFDATFTGRAEILQDYVRQESEATLGYVYLTPGAGRQPVYRMADPMAGGGFHNAGYLAPIYAEANGADYVVGAEAHNRLLTAGFRDDGVAFYAPDGAPDVTTMPVYRRLYAPEYWGSRISRYYTDGPEADARADDDARTVEVGVRFQVLPTQLPGTVALHRLNYMGDGNTAFDVLAAGEPRFRRALHQGNQPIWSLTWPGITARTTFVIEALDAGCPFPSGYVSPIHAPESYGAAGGDYPSLTVDEARLASTGELFINGQHDPANRPKPIARAYVDVEPAARPTMDFYDAFDASTPWDPFTVDVDTNNGVYVMRNSRYAADFSGCSPNLVFAPLLGQLVLGFDDAGSSCNISIVPRGVDPRLGADHFVHVRMSTDVPSTLRRYPQIMITNTPVLEPGQRPHLYDVPLHTRLGPLPFDGPANGDYQSIIVQPFGAYHEIDVEFCDRRGWGVGHQCDQGNSYGYHAGSYSEDWGKSTPPWLPVPVLGEVAGYDRPVQFDVYASTERVYVFVDERPAGCAILPPGRMPAGPVTVAYRAVGYHLAIDDPTDPKTGQQYLRRYSLMHSHRHMDDFGIDKNVPPPPWNETLFPCGTRWYGGN